MIQFRGCGLAWCSKKFSGRNLRRVGHFISFKSENVLITWQLESGTKAEVKSTGQRPGKICDRICL